MSARTAWWCPTQCSCGCVGVREGDGVRCECVGVSVRARPGGGGGVTVCDGMSVWGVSVCEEWSGVCVRSGGECLIVWRAVCVRERGVGVRYFGVMASHKFMIENGSVDVAVGRFLFKKHIHPHMAIMG